MPQRFQAAQAGLGYRMPLHKQMISKLSVHFTVAGFLFATLGSSRRAGLLLGSAQPPGRRLGWGPRPLTPEQAQAWVTAAVLSVPASTLGPRLAST